VSDIIDKLKFEKCYFRRFDIEILEVRGARGERHHPLHQYMVYLMLCDMVVLELVKSAR
jgi:hypothetical protein